MPTVETRTGLVAYEEHGSGIPLLLLHANPGDHRHFDGIVPALARHYRTIAIDWPGYGHSTPPDPPRSATAMLLADVLEDVVEGLHLTSALFLGNSVGGYAAARLAIRHPERVQALILVSSGGFTPDSMLTRLFCQVKGREFVTRLIATRFARFYLKQRNPLVAQILRDIEQGRANPSRMAIDAALWRSFMHSDHDLRPVASQIVAPTLLVYGRSDPIIRFDKDGRNALACMAGAQRIVLETGHEPFAEHLDAFLQAVTPFLQVVSSERKHHVPSNTPGTS